MSTEKINALYKKSFILISYEEVDVEVATRDGYMDIKTINNLQVENIGMDKLNETLVRFTDFDNDLNKHLLTLYNEGQFILYKNYGPSSSITDVIQVILK